MKRLRDKLKCGPLASFILASLGLVVMLAVCIAMLIIVPVWYLPMLMALGTYGWIIYFIEKLGLFVRSRKTDTAE